MVQEAGVDEATGVVPVHVDAAARAAVLATEHTAAGVFNVAESEKCASTGRARFELGWRPGLR
jgi:hypothetical protein